MKPVTTVALLALCLAVSSAAGAAQTVWLDQMDLSLLQQGWGKPAVNKSVINRTLTLAGKEYERGVGSHGPGTLYFELDGETTRFEAVIGIDDETNNLGSCAVTIWGGGRELFRSEVLKGGGTPAHVDIDLTGIKDMTIIMESVDDNKYDHVDFADARFTCNGAAPKLIARPAEEAVILTPPPAPAPRINPPYIAGVRPGSPFLFRIPTTGERPIKFEEEGLPKGLALNIETGIINGIIESSEHKTYEVTLHASNTHGADTRVLRIVVGNTLALTPPMGWNHWYAHYDRVTDAMMREAADIMVSSGMADVGYQYVNIDDCWMNAEKNRDPKRVGPLRGPDNRIVPNSYFPDMPGLANYIHAKGLRAGLYTSPGPTTCAGFGGAYGFEELDAQTFAEWGFDFLKYDWCSYGDIVKNKKGDLDTLKKPYTLISGFLREQPRDIVLNLCQYGMGDVWKWGEEVGGHCWRTAGDLGFELTQYHDVALRNADYWPYAHPGAWNDPDYIQIGYPGDARNMGQPQPCPLTPNEQYAYVSLWAIMASPIFFSGDMTRLDPFTLNVLCNAEVIEVDQDPAGKQGRPVVREKTTEIWKKELEDGSLAVGLFNRHELQQPVTVRWADLGLTGPQKARDLWRQKDLGAFDTEFTATIPRHGVLLLKVRP